MFISETVFGCVMRSLIFIALLNDCDSEPDKSNSKGTEQAFESSLNANLRLGASEILVRRVSTSPWSVNLYSCSCANALSASEMVRQFGSGCDRRAICFMTYIQASIVAKADRTYILRSA